MGGGLATTPLYNMKRNILLSVFTFYSFTVAQTVDITKWISYNNTLLNITFNYPSFMQIEDDFSSENVEMDSSITIGFTDYRFFDTEAGLGIGDSTDTLHIALDQSLIIIVSKLSIVEIAPKYGYLYLDSAWYDSEMYEHGWSDEPASNYLIDDWAGFVTFTPTSVYFKEGGCLTHAGNMRVFFLSKKISESETVFVSGERFDFDDAEIILKKILNSISLIK